MSAFWLHLCTLLPCVYGHTEEQIATEQIGATPPRVVVVISNPMAIGDDVTLVVAKVSPAARPWGQSWTV
jgi:hypothetical protein